MCKIAFDAKTGTYGDHVDTLLNAREWDKSFTYPRASYDGKWLMFNVTNCGNFPVNHPEADLWLMNLQTGETHPLSGANSDDTESFHNWSLNSHWFVFSSRRENGVYSMPYIAFIDDKGRAKLDIALCRGKKEFDKRQTLKEKEDRREMDRAYKALL